MTWQRTEFDTRDDAQRHARRRGILTPDGKPSQAGEVLGDGFTVQENGTGKRWWNGAQRNCQGRLSPWINGYITHSPMLLMG